MNNGITTNHGKTNVNDINIYFELHGKNNHHHPIVLISGFTCDHTFWTGVLNTLSEKHTVLIFDNRGIGQSDSPDHPYSIDMMADDVISLCNKLDLKKPILIGQSMGSAIAQNIAKRYKNQISKLVLMNTFFHLTKAPEMAFELISELQRLNLPIHYLVQAAAPWVYSSEFLSKPNQLTQLIKLAENNPYPQSLVGYARQLDALKSFNSHSWLHEIETPTLIIAGKEDRIAPLAGAMEVHSGIGTNAQIVAIPGGHASPIEHPTLVAKTILDFSGNE